MIPIWKNIPFLRLLLPLMTGILMGWYFQLHFSIALYLMLICLPTFLFYSVKNKQQQYFFRWIPGLIITLLFTAMGILLCWFNQVIHQPQWIGQQYKEGDFIQIRLLEPLTEKEKSYKVLAKPLLLERKGKAIAVSGQMLLYFQKDSLPPTVEYGNIILVRKKLQAIKSAGNPGGFDYKRYALFNGITHQLYLKRNEYLVLQSKKTSLFWKGIYWGKQNILQILRRYIKGENQVSVAEALLIGYRDDLDKDLVQAYSNTGVVHVIAISGMHLGLIYGLLLLLFRPLNTFKGTKWLKPIIVLSLLWIFSLLTGAGASVLRAALMFTVITTAELLNKKGNIYNSLAASAFLLLCYNPFYLWDVGFQLSYAAVLSIVLFMKPIYHWFTINNKLLDYFWQLNAVTISAQLLTLPLCLYHFHQAPNLFLISNLVAVPLSSIILFAELFLLAIPFMPSVAAWTGRMLGYLLGWMNDYISWVNRFSFAVTDGIQQTALQTILLYGFITAVAIWLMQQQSKALKWALSALFLFFLLQDFALYKSKLQEQIVVYHIPQHTAIDLMLGNQYYFIGDSILQEDGFLRNFNLNPSRILYQTYGSPMQMPIQQNRSFIIKNKRILIIDQSFRYDSIPNRIKADLLIVTSNPTLYIRDLLKTIDCKLIVFDGAAPEWKQNYWKKDCDQYHLNYFFTSEQGAFVMKF